MPIAADIDTFKAMVRKHGGMARTNRYCVYMTHPIGNGGLLNTDFNSLIGQAANSLISGQGTGLSIGSFFQDPRDIYLMCDAVNIPGRQITTQEYATGLRARKKPYNFFNEDVSMSFHLTNDYYMYKYIKSWMDGIIVQQADNHYSVSYKSDYVTDIIIQQLAPNGNTFLPAYSVKLKNAFPISLSGVQMGQEDNGVSKVTVTFAYDDYEEQNLAANLGSLFGGASRLLGGTLSAFS